MTAHLERQHGQCQNQPDPEPPPHVDKLRAWTHVGRDDLRLERHAADRAVAGAELAYLRMHWASVDHALLLWALFVRGLGRRRILIGGMMVLVTFMLVVMLMVVHGIFP
ncbi:hypothetical protein D9M68_751760 [compost metagenome]